MCKVDNIAADPIEVLSYYLLESSFFGFQGLEPSQITGSHTGVFGLPVVVGGVSHIIFTAEIDDLRNGLSLQENGDDLLLGILLHFRCGPPSDFFHGKTLRATSLVFGGRVTGIFEKPD